MRIKVLHLIKSLGRGGAEVLLPETLKLHNKERFDLQYAYFLPWKDQVVPSIIENGGNVTCFNANNNIQLVLRARQIAKFIRDNNIQILHAHLPWAGIVARIVGKMTGIPVVYTEHNKQERYHFLTRWMNLLTMNWLSEIIAVSEDVGVSIKKHKPSLKARLNVVLNGVNVDHFAPGKFDKEKIRNELNIPAGAPVILTIAVFRFQKRLDVWLEIASNILKAVPDAHFIIVGRGPLEKLLHDKCASLGLGNNVHFAGPQSEVRPYLATCDIYMMSSVFEGLPIALLEAMSSECPVISTDAGGIKEVVQHGEQGYLCPVESPEMLTEYAVKLIQDQSQRLLMAKKARKRIEEKFSMIAMVNELESIYTRLEKNTVA